MSRERLMEHALRQMNGSLVGLGASFRKEGPDKPMIVLFPYGIPDAGGRSSARRRDHRHRRRRRGTRIGRRGEDWPIHSDLWGRTDFPVIVLVNSGTASASGIVPDLPLKSDTVENMKALHPFLRAIEARKHDPSRIR